MLKIKEEFDYKSLSRRLDIQLDRLIADRKRHAYLNMHVAILEPIWTIK